MTSISYPRFYTILKTQVIRGQHIFYENTFDSGIYFAQKIIIGKQNFALDDILSARDCGKKCANSLFSIYTNIVS